MHSVGIRPASEINLRFRWYSESSLMRLLSSIYSLFCSRFLAAAWLRAGGGLLGRMFPPRSGVLGWSLPVGNARSRRLRTGSDSEAEDSLTKRVSSNITSFRFFTHPHFRERFSGHWV